ncbi:hypothetical protein TRVL_00086 [Trypanosoma vivax]|uniref:FHA domain-containing protein n=1 Tax=Trypanosoma vivax (strain Y486) TaxID=1055687 RepID=G0TTM2_TRYVY|nr:hypothetical protein TRVL_00086 [Trypanosoma vivax]CCC47303.1 conserved hypothetical protein [Trypanosoma vivax Y486]
MEQPFYGRTGALDGAYNALPVTKPRFATGQPRRWFPSLLTVPQRVLHSVTSGDGVDASILRFLRVALVFEELRKRHPTPKYHGVLLREVLQWHSEFSLSQKNAGKLDMSASALHMFQPYLPVYNLRVLKDKEAVASYKAISRRAATLLGKDRSVNDIPLDHPSCSGQHAALEVRFVHAKAEEFQQRFEARVAVMERGESNAQIPWDSRESISELCSHGFALLKELGDDDDDDSWLMELQVVDLGSTNGTRLNGELLRPMEPQTVIEGDILTFGCSSRSYVVVRT